MIPLLCGHDPALAQPIFLLHSSSWNRDVRNCDLNLLLSGSPPPPTSSVSLVLIPWKDKVRNERGLRGHGMRLNPSLRRRIPLNPEERKTMRSEGPGDMPETKKSPGSWEGTKADKECIQEAGGTVVCLLWWLFQTFHLTEGADSHGGPGQGYATEAKSIWGWKHWGVSKDAASSWVRDARLLQVPGTAEAGRWWRNGKW